VPDMRERFPRGLGADRHGPPDDQAPRPPPHTFTAHGVRIPPPDAEVRRLLERGLGRPSGGSRASARVAVPVPALWTAANATQVPNRAPSVAGAGSRPPR
jgi:hypothetical protein